MEQARKEQSPSSTPRIVLTLAKVVDVSKVEFPLVIEYNGNKYLLVKTKNERLMLNRYPL